MPTLNLELPVMSTWSYPQMKLAPCRYNGSIRGEDLVIMAHNYSNHFGKISQLSVGDNLSFTDADGVTTVYTVVAQDIVESTAVEEVTDGTYDLTLFTCTYGGGSRVTVYCNKA
jgi:sortase A